MSIVTIINIMKHRVNIRYVQFKYVKRVDLILYSYQPPQKQQTNPTKEHRKSFSGNGRVQYLGCGVGIMGIYIYARIQIHPTVYIKCVQFLKHIDYISIRFSF